MPIEHATIRIERDLAVPVPRVFAAWRDARALLKWYVPGDDSWTSSIIEHDFRVGGRKDLTFGPAGEPPYEEHCVYADIVENQRIVFSMVIQNGGTRLSASLVSVELASRDRGCLLSVTDQMAALDGTENAPGRERGWREVLEKLAANLNEG